MVPRVEKFVVLQHNLGKGKVATAEIREMARRTGASLLLLQEPWVRENTICGLGSLSNRILKGTADGGLYCGPGPPDGCHHSATPQ